MPSEWIRLHLPGWRHLGRYVLWGAGRVAFSFWLFGLSSVKETMKVGVKVVEMTERATLGLMQVYNQLPYMGTQMVGVIDTAGVEVGTEPENIITDLMSNLSGKHCLIVGDTGAGKSLIAQYLAYQIGGNVTVYDSDASPDEWVGLNVVGRCGDFASIQEAMLSDLMELQRRVEIRGVQGDRALAGLETVLIAEEFPLLRDEVETATDWLIKHARRGRKPKCFVIALAQDDNVKTLGIEGEGGVRKCFRMLRLGKFAVTHAKTLKDKELTEWLQSGKYRCMVDDTPCQLPDLSSYKMSKPRLLTNPEISPAVNAEPPTQRAIQPEITNFNQNFDPTKKAAKACLQAGLSDSKIIKQVLGCEGGNYQKGKNLLAQIRQEMEV